MTELLFSYGTLQKSEVQLKLFGRLLNGAKDVLKNYRVVPIEITDEGFLAKGEEKFQLTAISSEGANDFIEGTALEISLEEICLTDEYEPDNYKRIKAVLASGKEAWLYTAD